MNRYLRANLIIKAIQGITSYTMFLTYHEKETKTAQV